MTRPDLDRHFTEAYTALVRLADQRMGRGQGADVVHAVYCQIVTSESYRPIDPGKKLAREWLLCRVALQVKGQRRHSARAYRNGGNDEGHDEIE